MSRRRLAAGALAFTCACTSAAGQGARANRRPEAVLVESAPVQHISVQRTVDLAGTLMSPDQAHVSSEVAGVVRDVNVQLGQAVQRGQQLIRIEPRELQLALDRAESALKQTE